MLGPDGTELTGEMDCPFCGKHFKAIERHKCKKSPSKKTTWDDVYQHKTERRDLNKEVGDFYEILSLYRLDPHMNTPQVRGKMKLKKWRRNLLEYIVQEYARGVELKIGAKSIFETDDFISLQVSSRLARWIQRKAFSGAFFKEFGVAIQCKSYKGKVDYKHVKEDVAQTGLADILGGKLIKHTRKLKRGEEVLESLGEITLNYNQPYFERELYGELTGLSKVEVERVIAESLKDKRSILRELHHSSSKLEEQIGNEVSVAFKINKVVEYSIMVEGTNYQVIKVMSEQDEDQKLATIYYIFSGKECFKVIEQPEKHSLGELVFTKRKRRGLPNKYCLVNLIEGGYIQRRREINKAREKIKIFLNPEMFAYLSTHGLQEKAQGVLEQVNGREITLSELENAFATGEFFKDLYQKIAYDPNYGAGGRALTELQTILDIQLAPITEQGVPYKRVKKSIQKFTT